MDITPEVAYLATFPTTALTEPYPSHPASNDILSENLRSWERSTLNPKNRIDSLVPVRNPRWRIDGCTRMATQFYTIPTFAQPLVPIRIDTFIPPRAQWQPELIEMLESDRAFLYCDARVLNFGIAQHILRTLEHWSSESEFPNFQTYYMSLPFGSRIVFENIAKDVRQVRVRTVPMHSLERELISVTTLQSMWKDVHLPPTLDISQLGLLRQFHDSVSLVCTNGIQDGPENVVLKALIVSPKYLYHELRILLTMPPHPNIAPSPLLLVTKRCRFGGKIGVIGFTSTYHDQGTLRDILPFRRIHETLRITDQLKWARQLTDALIHIQENGSCFHCDLRLDNILLSDTDDVLLIDFEHRGILANSAAPEVSCLEYVDLIANHSSFAGPERKKYEMLFDQYIKPHVSPNHEMYQGEQHGYYSPWLCLSEKELEAAEVYMLGRVLWCIFEGVSTPHAMLGVEYLREPDLEFPEFRRTPLALQTLVLHCTRGWTPWLGGLKRRGPKLGFGAEKGSNVTAADVIERIGACCREELKSAEDFLRKWDNRRKHSEENIFNRPGLKEIAQVLSDFQGSHAADILC
jgi:hypothetical protein